jgi:hypothetical protein
MVEEILRSENSPPVPESEFTKTLDCKNVKGARGIELLLFLQIL